MVNEAITVLHNRFPLTAILSLAPLLHTLDQEICAVSNLGAWNFPEREVFLIRGVVGVARVVFHLINLLKSSTAGEVPWGVITNHFNFIFSALHLSDEKNTSEGGFN